MNIQNLPNVPFGAVAEEIDCKNLTDDQSDELRQTICEKQLLVIRNQEHLSPTDEVVFHKKMVGEVNTVWRDQVNNPWEVYKVEQGNQAGTYQIPGEPAVLVIGKGKIDHCGLKVELGGSRSAYGKDKGSQVLGGGALQWHIDGAFYDKEPCKLTQMTCVEAPKGEGHWIDYNDGSGARLWAGAGATAFASGRIAFDKLKEIMQKLVLSMQVYYTPEPFKCAAHLGNNDNGLRIIDTEAEQAFEKQGKDEPGVAFNDEKAKVYPLVWSCPVTDKKALMLHPRCMHHLEDTSTGRHLGVVESRKLIESLMRPAVDPELVVVHNWEPGDLVVWNNHSIWHSATGGLGEGDRRIQHLTAFDGIAPLGP